MAASAAIRRLKREFNLLQKDPEANFFASPLESSCLEWHFIILGSPDTPYHGGIYHGKLTFPPQFPMKPPSIQVHTASSRFVPNQKICMSMSDFHPELWNPSWSVRTILVGLLSFWNSEELTTGGMRDSAANRVELAKASLAAIVGDKIVNDLFPKVVLLAKARLDECESSKSWPPPSCLLDEEKLQEQKQEKEIVNELGKLSVTAESAASRQPQPHPRPQPPPPPPPPVSDSGKNAERNRKKREKEKAKKKRLLLIDPSAMARLDKAEFRVGLEWLL